MKFNTANNFLQSPDVLQLSKFRKWQSGTDEREKCFQVIQT